MDDIISLFMDVAKDTKQYVKLSTGKFMEPMFTACNIRKLAEHLTNIGKPYCEFTKRIDKREITIRIDSKILN